MRYKTKVRIISGFYAGVQGVIMATKKAKAPSNAILYKVVFDNTAVWFNGTNLEKYL